MSISNIRPPDSRTDVNYQEVKLFVEGIQLPFIDITISSAIGTLPRAQITVPPQVGLMEITRFYNPKVHIFFIDPIDNEERVLFSGILQSSNFSKTADGSASISFTAAHKYQLLTDLLLDYSGWTNDIINPRQNEQAFKPPALSSEYSIQLAMTGVFMDDAKAGGKKPVTQANVAADVRENKFDASSPAVLQEELKEFKNRLIGIPSILLNFWNQLKQFAYTAAEINELMIKMYIPLLEEGLQLFKRVAGHYYLESKIDDTRIDPCPDEKREDAASKPRLVPPSCKNFLKSAVQTDMSVKILRSSAQFSGELADLLSIYFKFLSGMDYEAIFLNSPAEVYKDPSLSTTGQFTNPGETYAVDLIVKPQIPFYYSPLCNVLYPTMINSVSVSQDDYNIPTRINVQNNEPLSSSTTPLNTNYRAPASIREALANFAGTTKKDVTTSTTTTTTGTPSPGTTTAPNAPETTSNPYNVPNMPLINTLGPSHSVIGKFEQGRGVKFEKIQMPSWLRYYSHSQFKDAAGGDGWPTTGSDEAVALEDLSKGWEARYGTENKGLNPWSRDSGLSAHQRIMIASADYYYAMTMARSRAGSVSCIFNPYIITGYPMDILDSTPNHPSFHAYCTSVTHSITASSIRTEVGFVSAVTYTELANYYLPAVHPWLQQALGLARKQSIVNYQIEPTTISETDTELRSQAAKLAARNMTSKDIADALYVTPLGVGAAAPSQLYNFETGTVLPVKRVAYGLVAGVKDSLKGSNSGEINPSLTGIGGLSLVYRPIETRAKVEERGKIKFIDITPGNYNSSVIRINNKVLAEKDAFEPGQSQWLKYDPKFEDPTDSNASL